MEYTAIIFFVFAIAFLLSYLAINLQESHPFLSITFILSIFLLIILGSAMVINIGDLTIGGANVNTTLSGERLQNNIQWVYRLDILVVVLSFFYVTLYLIYQTFMKQLDNGEEF